MTNMSEMNAMSKKCTHGIKFHEDEWGINRKGDFATAEEAEYTKEFCQKSFSISIHG